jgi:hypothetical protein
LIGRVSFGNLKETLGLFLYEADKQADINNVMRLMRYFDTFNSKQPKEGNENSIKNAIKDHIIWKGK